MHEGRTESAIKQLQGAKLQAQPSLYRGGGWPMPGAIAELLLPMAKLASPVNLVRLKNIDIFSVVAVAATHGELQEDQSGEVRGTQLRCTKVR
jgi:hypothetical protein